MDPGGVEGLDVEVQSALISPQDLIVGDCAEGERTSKKISAVFSRFSGGLSGGSVCAVHARGEGQQISTLPSEHLQHHRNGESSPGGLASRLIVLDSSPNSGALPFASPGESSDPLAPRAGT